MSVSPATHCHTTRLYITADILGIVNVVRKQSGKFALKLLNTDCDKDNFSPHIYFLHSCMFKRIIRIIRLGKNPRILTNFIMDMNVQNN